MPHIITHFQPNTSLLNSSLGGISFGIDSEGNYGYYKYDEEAGADTLVPFKKGFTIKKQTISTGRIGVASSRTFTFSQLSKVDGVLSSSCRIYYSSGDDCSCDGISMSISGNKVTLKATNYSGGTYSEWSVTAFEIILE